MKYDELVLDNPNLIVNAFADYFSSVYLDSHLHAKAGNPEYSAGSDVSISHISEKDVYSTLKNFKNSFTMGPDSIPSFLLRDCATVFVQPLVYLYNLIIKTSIFPVLWKTATICPLFKKGDKADVTNYRPISLLSNFAKAFESILYKYIYMDVKMYISPSQHGFMKKRSTITNLVCFTQFTCEAIDSKQQVDTVYLDFWKAFDQIDHNILLQKLHYFGFSDSLIKLFQSYLVDRVQYVQYRCYKSKNIVPGSGVPQGSNLGPLLFLLFVNDITEVISSNYLLFADDLKIYRIINSPCDSIAFQNDLNNVYQWCLQNRLFLNIAKCLIVTYTRKFSPMHYQYSINNVKLQRKSSILDLGVLFDSAFTFTSHMENMICKAYKTLGFIFRNSKEFKDIRTLKLLFFGLVRSTLEYGSIIWHSVYHVHVNNIESVQRVFLKFLAFREDRIYPVRGHPQSQLLNRFNIISLNTRRLISGVRFLLNLINYEIDSMWLLRKINFLTPRYNARQSDMFYCPSCKSNLLQRSPIVVMCRVFNKISQNCDITDKFPKVSACIIAEYEVSK